MEFFDIQFILRIIGFALIAPIVGAVAAYVHQHVVMPTSSQLSRLEKKKKEAREDEMSSAVEREAIRSEEAV